MKKENPVIWSDYPDPDIIRVEDTYYMISTTMHMMPGGVVLRSYDLLHWEIASYVFAALDHRGSACVMALAFTGRECGQRRLSIMMESSMCALSQTISEKPIYIQLKR